VGIGDRTPATNIRESLGNRCDSGTSTRKISTYGCKISIHSCQIAACSYKIVACSCKIVTYRYKIFKNLRKIAEWA
jgi:hypothetical protein